MEQNLNYLWATFGWFTGILALVFVEHYKEQAKRNSCKILIESDLKNLALRLASTHSRIQRATGIYDKASLETLVKTYEKYAEGDDVKHTINMKELLKKMETENLKEIRLQKDEFDALGLKRASLPFLQSNQESLLLFPKKFQRDVLEILSQVGFFDEEVDLAMGFYHKTFDPNCMNVNHAVVMKSLSLSYADIQRRCLYLLKKIDNVVLEKR